MTRINQVSKKRNRAVRIQQTPDVCNSTQLNDIKYLKNIKRNKKRDSNKTDGEYINSEGIPVCKTNQKMIFYGYDIQRCRSKFRYPLAMGKIEDCKFKEQCSNSEYGRVKYVNDGDDARNIPIVYKSKKWKQIYNNRTSSERINNYVLNTYGLHKMSIRNGAKQTFFSIMTGINMHLYPAFYS